MVNIYKIVNDVNDKVYVGQTHYALSKRFSMHRSDARHPYRRNRPLYVAMNEIGVEHFHIELIEVTEFAAEREQYWIQYYDSFHNGYNATYGGAGKPYVDYDLVLDLYDHTSLSLSKIAKHCKCSADSVRAVVAKYRENVDWVSRIVYENGQAVLCIETQQVFPSCGRAANWLQEQGYITNEHSCRSQLSVKLRTQNGMCEHANYHWKSIKSN